MLNIVLIAVPVIIVLFIVIVSLQRADFRIARSANISAPGNVVFAQVNDFHNWEAWSPWLGLDPATKTNFEGPATGAGAIFTWSGNKKVGEGRMTILESRPNDSIRIELKFIRPWQATSIAEFTFKLERDQTAVTWAMTGKRKFMEKAVCLFMNMDKMVGGDFEKGLAKMKNIAEGRS